MRALGVVRDLVVIGGVVLLCSISGYRLLSDEWNREARLTVLLGAVGTLENAYRETVYDSSDNQGIMHQVFRQNEVLVEYQKLNLIKDLLSPTASEVADVLRRAAEGMGAGPGSAPAGEQPEPIPTTPLP